MNLLRLVAILLFLVSVVAAPTSAAVTYVDADRVISATLNQAGTLCCGGIYDFTSQFGAHNVDVESSDFIYPEPYA